MPDLFTDSVSKIKIALDTLLFKKFAWDCNQFNKITNLLFILIHPHFSEYISQKNEKIYFECLLNCYKSIPEKTLIFILSQLVKIFFDIANKKEVDLKDFEAIKQITLQDEMPSNIISVKNKRLFKFYLKLILVLVFHSKNVVFGDQINKLFEIFAHNNIVLKQFFDLIRKRKFYKKVNHNILFLFFKKFTHNIDYYSSYLSNSKVSNFYSFLICLKSYENNNWDFANNKELTSRYYYPESEPEEKIRLYCFFTKIKVKFPELQNLPCIQDKIYFTLEIFFDLLSKENLFFFKYISFESKYALLSNESLMKKNPELTSAFLLSLFIIDFYEFFQKFEKGLKKPFNLKNLVELNISTTDNSDEKFQKIKNICDLINKNFIGNKIFLLNILIGEDNYNSSEKNLNKIEQILFMNIFMILEFNKISTNFENSRDEILKQFFSQEKIFSECYVVAFALRFSSMSFNHISDHSNFDVSSNLMIYSQSNDNVKKTIVEQLKEKLNYQIIDSNYAYYNFAHNQNLGEEFLVDFMNYMIQSWHSYVSSLDASNGYLITNSYKIYLDVITLNLEIILNMPNEPKVSKYCLNCQQELDYRDIIKINDFTFRCNKCLEIIIPINYNSKILKLFSIEAYKRELIKAALHSFNTIFNSEVLCSFIDMISLAYYFKICSLATAFLQKFSLECNNIAKNLDEFLNFIENFQKWKNELTASLDSIDDKNILESYKEINDNYYFFLNN